MLHCHLRPPVPPIIFGFNQDAHNAPAYQISIKCYVMLWCSLPLHQNLTCSISRSLLNIRWLYTLVETDLDHSSPHRCLHMIKEPRALDHNVQYASQHLHWSGHSPGRFTRTTPSPRLSLVTLSTFLVTALYREVNLYSWRFSDSFSVEE